ncbi:MAG: hypothetical protein BGO68_01030 [Candidatus Amoebophilus sp. 36-38]|nr:MAG: hypothetical protein BGO68_01030 [Candidatus Amoebophilus sp. 36-38]
MSTTYHELLETFVARFGWANSVIVKHPFTLHQLYTIQDVLIYNHGIPIYYAYPNQEPVACLPGEFLCIPSRQAIQIRVGSKDAPSVPENFFMTHYATYLTPTSDLITTDSYAGLSYISFDMQVLGCVNLLDLWDVSAMTISPNDVIRNLYNYILLERQVDHIAQKIAFKHAVSLLGLEIVRYMLGCKSFLEGLASRVNYLQDKRILTILSYINKHIDKELSNKVLAGLAHISEDYMGQYFKLAMNERPQAYVEYQRMKKAIHLLQTTSKAIQTIAKEIGLKDTAYFCRRFKNLFGMQPSKARKQGCILTFQVR